MNKQVLKQIKSLVAGDLVRVEWYDASVGKSLTGGIETIDASVHIWDVQGSLSTFFPKQNCMLNHLKQYRTQLRC